MENQLQSHHQIMDRRHDALGDLRVLPDEVICDILEEYFSPLDLARLSCVSSVLYILCNEEPLWMRLCLKQGGQLQYKGSWKKTTLYRQNLWNAIDLSREKPLQFYGFNSLFLYRRWYRCYTTLSNFNFDTGLLEKRKNLTIEEFCSQYDGKKPVLLTELAENWPARIKWTKDQLALSHGDVAFRISQRSSKKIMMTFKDYVFYMEHQHDEDPLYIFDDKFGEVAPSLLEDFKVPHLFQEDFFDVLDHDQRPPFRWLIIGPERSGASWHVDPALTSAWNTLLFGRKRWALYPPGRVPAGVTVHVNEDDGDVNIDGPTSLQWWLDVYPHLAECDKPIECTQLPGETIYVPSGWWHCVLNLEITIAVTQNYVNKSNFGYTCLDMTPGHRHKGVCRAGLLAVNDEASISMNSRNYPDLNREEKRRKVLSGKNEPCRSDRNWKVWNNMENDVFSYDVDFISNYLEPERDHYTSVWCPSNCIGPREMRQWLHKLWITKPEMRQLIWKGACLALNVDRWLTCATQICTFHNLPFPNLDEQFPVGTGSNPVFLFSDYVIKICTEGGLESSLHSLGTELEFYNLLHKVKSPLLSHIPEIVCSGLLVNENGSSKPISWNGRELPNVIANSVFAKGDYRSEDFHFGIWRKMNFGVQSTDSNPQSTIWPYVVTKRCNGDIFANLRDALNETEMSHLASFLGEQLRNVHLLPVPPLGHVPDKPAENLQNISNGLHISKEWEPVIAILNRRRRNLKDRLSQWGDPIPEFLIEKVEEYIPQDLASLFNLSKSGEDEHGGFPTWIHSDIMDDNIHLESSTTFPDDSCNATINVCNGEETRNYWLPTHILDFSNLTIGDPLYDIIPIYLDIFRGDGCLLKKLIESYKLPLERTQNHVPKEKKKFARISYRAMCFCILHEDNVLGAIFGLWKDLKKADSWEKVEEAVWGSLNNYESSDQRF